MSKQNAKAVAHLQIDSADFFILYTLIGDQLHAAGDMNLNHIAQSLCLQAKAMGVTLPVFIDQLTICAKQVYGEEASGKVIQLN